MNSNDIQNLMAYEMAYISYSIAWGNWDKIEDFKRTLVEKSLEKSDFSNVSKYLIMLMILKIEQGDFLEAQQLISILFEMGKSYDSEIRTQVATDCKTMLLLKQKRCHEAKMEAEISDELSRKHITLMRISTLGRKAEALILLGEFEEARECILQAKDITRKSKFMSRYFIAPYLISHFILDNYMLRAAVESKKGNYPSDIQRAAYRSGNSALNGLKNYAPARTKLLCLMGEYHWLIGNQTKALKWWQKSIEIGEKLGAKPDLSRTYFEIGKSLLEPQSRYGELNGTDAQGYLERAETLFKEMNLERDLSYLESLKEQHGL